MPRSSYLDDKTFRVLLALSLFLILAGSRAALIRFAGNATPYMDEWDGDWGGLLRPYLDGTLTLDALAAPFNEHRILFTRLLVLSIFKLSGYWDVALQTIVNAVFGSALLVAVAFALARVLKGAPAMAAVVAPCLVNVVPFAFDNILLGFNTHFYLLPALSLAGLWLAKDSRAWSPRWAAGAACGAASFFCMASGALTLAAIAATHGVQMACGRRTGVREGLGIAALVAASVLLVTFVPHVPDSDAFRARSLGEFLSALASLACWPGGAVLGLLLPLPSALFCARAFADRPALDDPRWFNVAALFWFAAQIAALAFGRAQAVPQSRYFDTLVLGLTIHFVSALWLVQREALRAGRRKFAAFILAAWIAVVGVGLPRAERHLPRQIETWRETVERAGASVRFYLATGDGSSLDPRSGIVLPYPQASRLRNALDDRHARAALPPELTDRAPARNAVEACKQRFLDLAPAWLGLGVLTLLAGFFGRRSFADGARAAPEDAVSPIAAGWQAPA